MPQPKSKTTKATNNHKQPVSLQPNIQDTFIREARVNVAPREVFQRAVLTGAISIVLAHNHPSGSTIPSSDDRAVTRRLRESGELLGIKILDHLIVTNSAFLSMKEDDGW